MLFWSLIVLVAVQRLFEMTLTMRHSHWMQKHGGQEYGTEHYPWMILLHVAFLASLVLERLLKPYRVYLWCLAPLSAAQLLRYSSIWALGRFWNTRIWVLPGAFPIRRGIFRWIRHPNYAGVVLEFFSLPGMFGLWITTVVFSLLNAWMLSVRIRMEDRALREGGARR